MTTHLGKNIKRDTGSFIDTLVKKEYFDSSLYDELMDELNSLIEARNSEDVIFIQKNISDLISFTKNLFVLYISHNDPDDIIDVDFSELGNNVDDEKVYEVLHMLAHKLIVLTGKIDRT